MLAGQVLDGRIELKIMVDSIAAAKIDLLIGRSKIAVRQQHGGAKERIRQKSARVPPADKVAANRERELAPRVSEIKARDVRRAIKWPVSNQRRKGANRDIGKGRI